MAVRAAAAAAAAVRVRFAPSPTGFLHVGGLRTALFNYLLAKRHGGKFLLRIEDTDQSRLVPGSIRGLIDALKWCGLSYDEGPVPAAPGCGSEGHVHDASCGHGPAGIAAPAAAVEQWSHVGDKGPYIQSQRLPIYEAAAEDLIAAGKAYRCFCTPERLAAVRDQQQKSGVAAPMYDRACSRLPPGEAERRAAAGEPHTVRLFVPTGASTIHDAVLGDVAFNHAVVDDTVLMKSDGYPTYHLASVVDDHKMDISHVIRGQEWLSSTPKHSLLYDAFGWAPPTFAHLPLLLNPDRTKLSKRQGHASVEDFRGAGYMPEALVNFVALLGWTSSDGKEVMTMGDMVERFDIGSIHKANAIVDRARLDFFNGSHMRMMMGAAPPPAPAARPTATPLAAAGAAAGGAGAAAAAAPATGKPAATGGREAPPPCRLSIPDNANFARIRAGMLPALDAELARLGGAADGVGDSTRYVPVASRVPADRLNAFMVVQADRVSLPAEFVPLVLPFVASEEEFASWFTQQASTDAAAATIAAGTKGNKAAPAAAAPTPAAPQTPAAPPKPTAEAVRDFYVALAPSLAEVASRWAALDDAGFEAGAVDAVKQAAKATKVAPGVLMAGVRFGLTGLNVGASLSDMMRLFGRARALERLQHARVLAEGRA